MLTIGVTGGVGCGKSAVLDYLADHYSCVILQTDICAREMQLPGRELYEPVIALLIESCPGTAKEDLLLADGRIDTRGMAARIFADPVLLEKINALIHPAVLQEVYRQIEEERRRPGGAEFFIIESALLIESGLADRFDDVWYIYCPERIRRERLRASGGYSDAKTDSIIATQLPEEVFRVRCRRVIDNGGGLEETAAQIDAAIRALREEQKE